LVQLVALYRPPEDKEAFLRRYRTEHLPLAAKMPGLVSMAAGPLDQLGMELPYWYMATLDFPDRDTLMASQRAPESRAALKALMAFAQGLVDFAVREVEE
jgi:uncharacterized protein (TIGR02118 family)